MPPSNFYSGSGLRKTTVLKRLAFTLFLTVTISSESWAQEPSPKPITNSPKIHWHKYINKKFGFSLRYPDAYRPITDPEYCKDNDCRRWSLCLERRDDPETKILVTIVVAVPFFIKTNAGGNEHTLQQIGQRVFYCGREAAWALAFPMNAFSTLMAKHLNLTSPQPRP